MQNIPRKVDIYGPSKLQKFLAYKTLIFQTFTHVLTTAGLRDAI